MKDMTIKVGGEILSFLWGLISLGILVAGVLLLRAFFHWFF
jgi:hypothetical protein